MDNSRRQILLIDDDEDYFVITRDLLAEIADRPFVLDWASSYRAGLAAIAERRHDAYLVDYRLGEHNGLDLLAQAQARGCQAPIILLTGQGDRKVDRAAIQAGAADYLVKGQFDATLLERAIDHAIERAQTSRTMARLATVVDQSPEIIVITNQQGLIEYVNPSFERITGYSSAEVCGRNPRLFKSGKHSPAFYAELWHTLLAGQTWHGELTNKKKDGNLYVAKANISPVRDATGAILNFVAISRDISYEKQIEGQLRQIQKMEAVGRLAGGVAHDFNNLLTVITGYCSLLLRHREKGDGQRAELEEILKAAERAAALTRQLLAFSRKQLLNPKVIDLNNVVAGMETMLRRLIGENIELRTVLPRHPCTLKADAGQIEQVILNLAVNARDAMPAGGKLVIQTSRVNLDQLENHPHNEFAPGEYVRITVTDTGIGMTDQVKAHLFEPFFTTKGLGKGTGLGLATCYGIIKQSGGHILVYSEPGHGSVFKIYLPATPIPAEMALAAPSESKVPPRGRETILLVEDEDALRELAACVLRESGYTVVMASNGQEGLRIVRESRRPQINLILTDMIMPLMGGKEMVEQLRSLLPQAKVLFTSGYTDDALAEQGVLAPGIAFLEKPFSPAHLTHQVRTVLDQAEF